MFSSPHITIALSLFLTLATAHGQGEILVQQQHRLHSVQGIYPYLTVEEAQEIGEHMTAHAVPTVPTETLENHNCDPRTNLGYGFALSDFIQAANPLPYDFVAPGKALFNFGIDDRERPAWISNQADDLKLPLSGFFTTEIWTYGRDVKFQKTVLQLQPTYEPLDAPGAFVLGGTCLCQSRPSKTPKWARSRRSYQVISSGVLPADATGRPTAESQALVAKLLRGVDNGKLSVHETLTDGAEEFLGSPIPRDSLMKHLHDHHLVNLYNDWGEVIGHQTLPGTIPLASIRGLQFHETWSLSPGKACMHKEVHSVAFLRTVYDMDGTELGLAPMGFAISF